MDSVSEKAIEVLVVDDDVEYCMLLGMYMTRSTEYRYQPTLCHSGARAIELCSQERFDCVLMDYRLNDKTGAQVIGELRDSLDARMPPVIIMTSGALEDAAIASLRARATDFLLKDNVNQQSIVRAVRNAVKQDRLRRGIQERNTQLVIANIELERQSSEIQRFYHAVSHEIKTPLTATREFVSIVADGLLGPVNKKQLDVLNDALICCDQITTQFNDLVDITRMETGKLSFKIKPTPIGPLLKRAISISKSSAINKGIKLEYEEPEALPSILMDDNRISQVVSNLLNNAIKFCQEGDRIRLSIRRRHHEFVSIRITDTGCGIPKAYLSDIFDRLFQVETENTTTESGLGLGLSVAREIIRGHGSQLNVRSRLGLGSSFYFSLKVSEQS